MGRTIVQTSMATPPGTEHHVAPDDVAPFLGPIRAVAAAVLRTGYEDADVQDCTSETLRRAVEGRSRLRPGEPVRPWVLGIARHVALDILRARKRGAQSLDSPRGEDSPSHAETIPDSGALPDELLERARERHAIQSAMTELPEPMANALMKFHIDGKSYQEIAEELGVPLGTVATWVTRGRKALADKLGKRETLR
jgi:RNA polymerase sigma factor (sigma-70 family)